MVRARTFVLFAVAAAVVSVFAAGCSNTTAASPSLGAVFSKVDLVFGTGAEAVSGLTITANYTGWFFDPNEASQKGVQFDTSTGRGPITFTLGSGQVIEGWEQGIPGMRIGGTRQGLIPANAPLIFEIELLEVR